MDEKYEAALNGMNTARDCVVETVRLLRQGLADGVDPVVLAHNVASMYQGDSSFMNANTAGALYTVACYLLAETEFQHGS